MSVGESAPQRARERAITFGVTGHRPDRLPASTAPAVSDHIREVFEAARNWAGPGACVDVVVSLAEGADRIAARVALAAGCRLHVVLPFSQDQFALDFPGDASLREYRELFASATWVTELGGRREPEDARVRAYEQTGEHILRRSNIVIAVWDGREGRGPGGTADIVDDARTLGLPVIWIDPSEGTPVRALAPRQLTAIHPFFNEITTYIELEQASSA